MAKTAQSKMPQAETFEDLEVFPNISRRGAVFGGGPAWPDWDAQIWPRHCINNRPVDKYPEAVAGTPERVDTPLFWAGHLHAHFGHFLAEYSTRILPATKQDKNAKLLFGVMPQHRQSLTPQNAPRFFREILAWYNVPLENVLFCQKPMRAAAVSVVAQGEQMGRIAPFEGYLDLLDENTARNRLAPRQSRLLYVSRAKLPAYLGGHAGAAYLDAVLEKSGVRIIYPESLPLRTQLEYYQGAETLIFPEGSALHGAQLLGRGLGHVVVINRRTGRNNHVHDIAGAQIGPRCKSITFLEPLKKLLALYRPNGDLQVGLGIAVFDIEKLLENFTALGANVSRFWDNETYLSQRDEDILVWLEHSWQRSRRHIKRADQDAFLDDLSHIGLGHLTGPATKILDTDL